VPVHFLATSHDHDLKTLNGHKHTHSLLDHDHHCHLLSHTATAKQATRLLLVGVSRCPAHSCAASLPCGLRPVGYFGLGSHCMWASSIGVLREISWLATVGLSITRINSHQCRFVAWISNSAACMLKIEKQALHMYMYLWAYMAYLSASSRCP
jgi:hypothetical protein